ncbi:MAG TPA: hypothetical protein VNE63_19500 [Candidatus Acidoferrales bacterium]|nr:hypothetical protein [Candidatus Acidoferrales bacterium]
MGFWKFKDYVTEQHRSPLLEWYGTLEEGVQAEFDLLLKNLDETEDWDEVKPRKRKYKELSRRHEGLCELLLKVGKRKFRPLGILRRETREFIFLGGAEKIGQDATDPEGAFDEALRLKGKFEEGRGEVRDYYY